MRNIYKSIIFEKEEIAVMVLTIILCVILLLILKVIN